MMKTKLTTLCTISGMISCEPNSCKHICNGSYTSGDLKKNDTLIPAKDGTTSKVGSARRSTSVSTESSLTSISCWEVFSYCDTNSAITSDLVLFYHKLLVPVLDYHQLLALVLYCQQFLPLSFLASSPCQQGSPCIQRSDR